MTILAFAGRRRSGKTEASDSVVTIGKEMGISIRKVSFADSLREMFSRKTGIAVSMLLNPETKEEFRKRLVRFADEEREKDPDVFVNNLFASVLPGEHIVIDDMRLLNELVAVAQRGGKPFKIEASKVSREARGYKYDQEIDEHISETELDLSAHTFECLGGGRVFNNKSKEHLRAELMEVVRKNFVNIVFSEVI